MSPGIETALFWALVGALVAVHALGVKRRAFAPLFALLVMDGVAGVMVLAGSRYPSVWDAWAGEDAWIEWGTFFAFATATVLAVATLCRHWRDSQELGSLWLARVGWLAVIAVCLFVAGEELSWGQRLFGFRPPDVFLEHNAQQELNLHNFFNKMFDTRYQVALLAFVYGVVAPGLARVPRLAQTRFGRALRWVAPSPWLCPWFFAVALVELAYPVELTGEGAELALGVLFLLDGVRRAWPPLHQQAISVALVLVAGLVTPVLLTPLLHGADEEASAQALAELETLRGDILLQPVVRPPLFTKSMVHKRIFTAVQDGYFRFGDRGEFLEGQVSPAENGQRRDRKGYYLDPWNNAYWVHYRRQGGLILLYSFGANRRRDTDTDALLASGAGRLQGDDVGVLLAVPRW